MHVPDLSQPSQRTLHGVLRRQAEAIPDATFLWVDDQRISFAEVDAHANAWAEALGELGVGLGDSVAFLLRNRPEFVYATFGCLKRGAIWIPINVDYRGAWLRATLEDTGARVLVVDAALIARVAELGRGSTLRCRRESTYRHRRAGRGRAQDPPSCLRRARRRRRRGL